MIDHWERYAWLLSWLARAVLAVAVVRRRLPYPWFRTWLLFSLGLTLVLQWVGPSWSNSYLYAVLITEPVYLALLAAVVLEVFQGRAEGLVIVGRTGRALLATFISLSVAVSLASFLAGPQAERDAIVSSLFFLRKALVTTLCAFTLVTLLFFEIYPAPNRANLIRHHRLVAGWLAVSVASTTIIWFKPLLTPEVAMMGLSSSILIALGWLVCLTRAGEIEPPPASRSEAMRIEESAQALVGDLRASVRRLRPPRE